MILKKLLGQKWRNKYREQTYGHDAGGDGGMCAESNMETYRM